MQLPDKTAREINILLFLQPCFFMRSIIVESRRKSKATLEKAWPGARIVDVTSKATDVFVQFSPFYPHGDIPIPFSGETTAVSVEGIWQGLKVFANSDVCFNAFENRTMKNIKRTVQRFGPPLGHRKGITGTELLNYADARREIYLPAYRWMLQHKTATLLTLLRETPGDLVLLDYETNCDVNNLRKPLSHAGLIKAYLEVQYPVCG
jgi:hypothetical protein